MKRKQVRKLVSFILVIVSLMSVAAIMPVAASAANVSEGYVDVKEINGVTLYNMKTKQYMNFDYGTCKNGQPLRCWPWDGTEEQVFNIDQVKSGVYRIVANKNSKYAIDVYRGNAKLKAGQVCDIWKAGEDETAQNIRLYRCSDGSYILRMASNTNLAIASSGSKGQLKLVKFNINDKAQRWEFRDTTGEKIDVTKNISVPTNKVSGIPSSAYKKTGIVYTISQESYEQAITTRDYNGVSKGQYH